MLIHITSRVYTISALKNTAMGRPKTFPDAPGTFQNRSRATLGKHLPAGSTQERPRDAQEAAKGQPKAPRSAPRAPKSRPRGARKATKPLQNRPRSAPGPHFHALLVETLAEEAVGLIFSRFLRRALDGQHAPMCVSYHSCQCLVRVGELTHCMFACLEKSTFWTSQTSPKPLRIEPKPPQNLQNSKKKR